MPKSIELCAAWKNSTELYFATTSGSLLWVETESIENKDLEITKVLIFAESYNSCSSDWFRGGFVEYEKIQPNRNWIWVGLQNNLPLRFRGMAQKSNAPTLHVSTPVTLSLDAERVITRSATP